MALLNRTQPLEDRIKAMQAEIDTYIDSLAKAEVERQREQGGSIPFLVVRNIIAGKGCTCQQYLRLKKEEGK